MTMPSVVSSARRRLVVRAVSATRNVSARLISLVVFLGFAAVVGVFEDRRQFFSLGLTFGGFGIERGTDLLVGDDQTVAQHDDSVGVPRDPGIVRDEDRRDALFAVHRLENLHDLF